MARRGELHACRLRLTILEVLCSAILQMRRSPLRSVRVSPFLLVLLSPLPLRDLPGHRAVDVVVGKEVDEGPVIAHRADAKNPFNIQAWKPIGGDTDRSATRL